MQNINNDLLFYVFATIGVISALMVVAAKNPVRAVLNLILCFISTAAIWLLLDAEFLALALVLVYVGAVMVLFLFVVMMLDIDFASIKAKFTRWLPVRVLLVLAVMITLVSIIQGTKLAAKPDAAVLAYAAGPSNIALLGELVFTKYLLQFEIAGVLLLVAIIAAIALIYRGPRNRKLQSIAKQLKADPKQRLRLVDEL